MIYINHFWLGIVDNMGPIQSLDTTTSSLRKKKMQKGLQRQCCHVKKQKKKKSLHPSSAIKDGQLNELSFADWRWEKYIKRHHIPDSKRDGFLVDYNSNINHFQETFADHIVLLLVEIYLLKQQLQSMQF